jgi:hypothetical protein
MRSRRAAGATSKNTGCRTQHRVPLRCSVGHLAPSVNAHGSQCKDDQQAHHGNGPGPTATPHNLHDLALGLFAIHGITKIKQTAQSIAAIRSAAASYVIWQLAASCSAPSGQRPPPPVRRHPAHP